jgi:hypothetical protein
MTKRKVFVRTVAAALSVAALLFVLRPYLFGDWLQSEQQEHAPKGAAQSMSQIAAESAAIAASDAARVQEESQYRSPPR